MRIRIPALVAVLAVAALAENPDPKAIDALVAKLASKNTNERNEASAKLRAQRRTALPLLVRHLEKTDDPEVEQRLRDVLAPRHLAPKGTPDRAIKLGLARALQPTLDAYLGDDAEARAAAEAKLADVAPYAAVVVELRLAGEQDTEKRVRLLAAYYGLLHDTPARAKLIFEAAQGLETVARNHGPFKEKWQSTEVQRLRLKGKLLHWCFVDPAQYGRQLEKSPGMYAPYKDLPAARDLYRLSAAMYTSLAKDDPEADHAAEWMANAVQAARAAERCGEAGARTKG
jgi:hypothetical protein